MKPLTARGACMAVVTLTLALQCTSAVEAEGDLLAPLARGTRQAGNQEAVAQSPKPTQSNVNLATGRQAGASVGPQQQTGQVTTAPQRELLNYRHDLSLTQMTPEMLNGFLASEEDVIILTNCFEEFRSCQSKHGINLIKQLRELGIGGRCSDCTPKEQEHLDQMIYNFIQKFIGLYPKYWRRIVPNIGKFLVPRRPEA